MRPRAWIGRAPVLAAALGAWGCVTPGSHLVRTTTHFTTVAPPDDCATYFADPKAYRDEAWAPIRVDVGDDFMALYPSDQTWMIEVRDGYDEPLASREGFAVWLECGRSARRLEVKECHHADERMLFVSPTGLAPVGDRHDRCEVRIELATESQRWWDANWGVVLRSQLYERWISQPADRRPQR